MYGTACERFLAFRLLLRGSSRLDSRAVVRAARADGSGRQRQSPVAYVRYQERLSELRALDFDDLLGLTVELLRECPDVLEKYQDRYRYLMVDEFQDTNVAQYQLIRLLGMKHHNVCVVGDEDQSIYGWRKADVRNLVHFERDFPEVGVIMLEQNYRSTQTILDVASAIITPNLGRKPKRLWTDNPPGIKPVLHEAYDERDEACSSCARSRRCGGPAGPTATSPSPTGPTPSRACWRKCWSATACRIGSSAAPASTSAARSRTWLPISA
jgi:superfamily I DNA/RNA helicase